MVKVKVLIYWEYVIMVDKLEKKRDNRGIIGGPSRNMYEGHMDKAKGGGKQGRVGWGGMVG